MTISRRKDFFLRSSTKKAEWFSSRGAQRLQDPGWGRRRKGVPTVGPSSYAFQTCHFTAPTRSDLTSRPRPGPSHTVEASEGAPVPLPGLLSLSPRLPPGILSAVLAAVLSHLTSQPSSPPSG